MNYTALIALLQAALSLLIAVHANPNLPPSFASSAVQVAEQAISEATTALSASTTAQTAPIASLPTSPPQTITPPDQPALVGVPDSPVITSISGPTTVNVGDTNSWTVNASDPANSALSYELLWGDATSIQEFLTETAQTFSSTNSFTHTYAYAGLYNVFAMVKNSTGGLAQRLFKLAVVGATTTTNSASSANIASIDTSTSTQQVTENSSSASTAGCGMFQNGAETTFNVPTDCTPPPIECNVPLPRLFRCENGRWVSVN